ncbi:RluA family pseudouridine synthase [Aureivirga marina]|uniref:RluA family pseudouridine synthase n=1 Tax=Aureivirga marina TaxID=1182451 RepID=UPI0018CAB067|nr:RluA family pseudouridine synthase [Aureivirga marina]
MNFQKQIFKKLDVSSDLIPEKFTFPFYYEPHELAKKAAEDLQKYLENQTDFVHHFGFNSSLDGKATGKMFGVLVVENQQKEIGYISAFSGKLAGSNSHFKFVPPVFNMLENDGFFKKEELVITELNKEIEKLENAPFYLKIKEEFKQVLKKENQEIEFAKTKLKEGKKHRKEIRNKAKEELSTNDLEKLIEKLNRESQLAKITYKKLVKSWSDKVSIIKEKIEVLEKEILDLKQLRKQKSAELQKQLFENYTFLNIAKKEKSLQAIFQETNLKIPPAGAGECAAPKLLQFAFLHDLKPIVMAEFWWGKSPKTEIRNHKQFYPACRGKCEPILSHMLEGMQVAENPFLENQLTIEELEVVFEDAHLLVIHKPAGFLSVPGKTSLESVFTKIQKKYPKATGPLLVHRLDMATSGLLLIAKTKEIHKELQQQFLKKIVRKRYVALLDGVVTENKGIIDLPLRVDLEDRPRQLVCFEHGKSARTEWEVLERKDGKTRIHFFPITGRTHQLRVHAAHLKGLNCAIIGDELYGKRANRLHLHAEVLEFVHPISKEKIIVKNEAEF